MTSLNKCVRSLEDSLKRGFGMSKLKKAVLLGRKKGASDALIHLWRLGVEVPLVVVEGSDLAESAGRLGIKVLFDDAELYTLIEQGDQLVTEVDLVVSYLFVKRIKEPLFKLGRLGCLNFHPAPLPDYKSRAGYNTAILDRKNEFGVSVHFIDSEQFDAGPIIEVLRWPIDSQAETVLSLESTAQEKLFVLFKKTIQRFMRGEQIITFANAGGYYLTSKQLEAMKEVDLEKDSLEEIDRKIRAFFFPPYTGAYIRVGGQKITLVNQTVLDLLARKITK